MVSKSVFDAMEARDWNKVRDLIATTSSWHPQDLEEKHGEDEDTLLTMAAKLGKEDVVQLLLNAGADIEARNKYGATALHCAAESGHLLTAVILLDRGADIEAGDDDGYTALYWAAGQGHPKIVEFLLDRGADMGINNESGSTLLMGAASRGRSEVAALLIDRGANINAEDWRGWSALILAANGGHVAVVKLLCRKGADLTIKDRDGHNALFYAYTYLWIPELKKVAEEIIAVIQGEAEWRRVQNFVAFLYKGGLSAADWSGRGLGGGGLMPATDGTTVAAPFSLSGRQSKVLENRDLCRIVTSYIPKPL